MFDRWKIMAAFVAAGLVALSAGMAQAGCQTKGGKATAPTKQQAQWLAMETIVQQVSWSAWPGWVATGKMAGYVIKDEKYKCTQAGSGGVTCIGTATICTAGSGS